MNDFKSLSDILKFASSKGIVSLTTNEYAERQAKQLNESVGNLNEKDDFNCSECKNKGFLYVARNGEVLMRHCKCYPIRETMKRANESGLGNIIRDYTFAKYNAEEDWQKDILEKALAFCEDESAHWFYIGGQVGAGKTHICTAISAHYIKKGLSCKYMLWKDDVNRLKANITDYAEYGSLMDDLKNVDVLYIDDFLKVRQGTEPTNADMQVAFEIINGRMNRDKITIISSEFPLKRAIGFDEATISRLFEKTGIYKIDIDKDKSKNYRLRGK